MPAYAGKWRAAKDTMFDLMRRLALVPMVLDARGLDVSPQMILFFEKFGETPALATLGGVYAKKVADVAYGSEWFNWLCGRDGFDPKEAFHELVRQDFHGASKPPFNEEKRAEAGMPPRFLLASYRRLADRFARTIGGFLPIL